MRVSYNGVVLNRVATTSWNETVEYDSSGMNMLGNKISLTFEGSVCALDSIGAPQQPPQNNEVVGKSINVDLSGFSQGGDGAIKPLKQRLNIILRQLSMPRCELIVYDDVKNEPIFQAYPLTSDVANLTESQKRNVDINAGPKPRSVAVQHVYNGYARISVTFEVMKIRCLGGELDDFGELGTDPTKGFVVSNRCWTEETLDANFYKTRVFSGRLRVSAHHQSVHFYRDLYYPPLEDGFRRESVRFSESEDGLTLTYSITDKQIRCAAPYPATAFSGSVSYSVINGADMRMEMSLTMIGRPDAPKDALTARALQAITKKIQEFANGNGGFNEKFHISENLGDPPSVTINVAYRLFSSTKGAIGESDSFSELTKLYTSNIALIGKPLEFDDLADGNVVYTYERTKSSVPNPFGYNVYEAYDAEGNGEEEEGEGNKQSSSTMKFIKCLASVPCAISIPQYTHSDVEGEEITGLGTKVIKQNENTLAYSEQSSGIAEEAIEYPYSFYKSDITYVTDYARLVLPKAKQTSKKFSSGSFSGTISEGSFSLTITNDKNETIGSLSGTATTEQGANKTKLTGTASVSVETANKSNRTTSKSAGSGASTSTNTETSVNANTETLTGTFEGVVVGETTTGEVSGTISGTTVSTNEESAVSFTGSIQWNETVADTTTTKIVTLAQPIPKALVVIEAERFNRLPELPDPDEVVSTTGEDPISFICTKVETRVCEPQAARNNDGVSYSIIARYEYAMSRQYKQGDEVWLLQNPTFGASCYYPKQLTATGEKVADTEALKTIYKGTQISHSTYTAIPNDTSQEEPS